MSRTFRVIVLATAVVLSLIAEGTERVARLTVEGEGLGAGVVNGRRLVQPGNVPVAQFGQAFLDENTFIVHTTAEVDSALARTSADIDQRHVALTNQVKSTLQEQETRLRQDVLNAVDQLPQRVLADTAAQALKDAIITELREELAQMRKDLQAQLDALKADQ